MGGDRQLLLTKGIPRAPFKRHSGVLRTREVRGAPTDRPSQATPGRLLRPCLQGSEEGMGRGSCGARSGGLLRPPFRTLPHPLLRLTATPPPPSGAAGTGYIFTWHGPGSFAPRVQ
eukprot:gene10661-biopygen18321